MSDLRRLIAKMDQLNEAGPVMTPQAQSDIRSQADYGGEDDDARDEKGFLKRSTSPGLGGTIDIGGVDIPSDAIASGLGSAAAIGGLKNVGGSKFNKPTAPTTTTPSTLGGLQNKEPGTLRVGTPDRPPVAPPPAVIRKRGDPKFDPNLSKTDAQRQQDLKDVEARMDALQAQQGKPKVDIKDVQRQKELQQQISGDPRPAVWKDPRNPDAPASKSPPAADVAPPAPMYPPPLKGPEPAPSLGGRSFRDASAEVNNSPSMLSKIGDTIKGQAMPWRGEAPPPSVYGPGGIKNFRRDAPVYPDPSKFGGEDSAAYALAKDKYNQQVNPPGPWTKGLAAAGTAAALYGPDIVKSIVDTPGQVYMYPKQPPEATDKEQPPADDASKDQTKESLQNKLFKEFKTFVEKR